jgi:hypothetical protein
MIMSSVYEVRAGSINELLVPQVDQATFEVKYSTSPAAMFVRVLGCVSTAVLYVAFVCLFDGPWKSKLFVGVTLLAAVVLFSLMTHVVTRVDAARRAILQGYGLFGRLELGLAKYCVVNGDFIRIRVTTSDGEDRHRPMHEMVVVRRGWRRNITIAHYVSENSEELPFFETLAATVASLLQIDYDG